MPKGLGIEVLRMWRTQHGERTLEGAEAVVFAEALSSLLDEANAGELDYYDLGVEYFDTLTFGQKISVLSTIGKGLLRQDIPPVSLTAILEGAIAAVFEYLKDEIVFEIDRPVSQSNWRELVVAARKEAGAQGLPNVYCNDPDEWEEQVNQLTKKILRDKDYEDAKLYIDLIPEESKQLRDLAGINDHYFLAIANDLTDEEAQAKIKELQGKLDEAEKLVDIPSDEFMKVVNMNRKQRRAWAAKQRKKKKLSSSTK